MNPGEVCNICRVESGEGVGFPEDSEDECHICYRCAHEFLPMMLVRYLVKSDDIGVLGSWSDNFRAALERFKAIYWMCAAVAIERVADHEGRADTAKESTRARREVIERIVNLADRAGDRSAK